MAQPHAVSPYVVGGNVSGPVPRVPLVDVRPILPRTPDGLFVRMEQIRDALHVSFTQELARHGLQGNVLRSGPFVHPCWVKVEVWQPAGEDSLVTLRSSAVLGIVPRPYHRYEVEYDLKLDCRGHQTHIGSLSRFGSEEVSQLVRYLVGESVEPDFAGLQLRQQPWQLWKDKNRPDALAVDWLGVFTAVLGVLGVATLGVGIGVLFLAGCAVTYWLSKRRQVAVRTSGKPLGEPRVLAPLDSWQAVVFGAGSTIESVRARFIARLQRPFSNLMTWHSEQIWYWGLDGITEREQIVVMLGRAIVFAHVHRYGDDLYVAWDGHLNRGTWIEKDLFRGIDRKSGKPAVIRVVEAGTQAINEYDLTDANSLDEFVHAQLVQVVKQIIAEMRIDQEIDFKVIRGERKGVTSGGEGDGDTGTGSGIAGRARGLLRRLG